MISNLFTRSFHIQYPKSGIYFVLLLATFFSYPCIAQDSLNFSLQFREQQYPGQVWTTTIHNNFLYEGIYTVGVKIWDVTVPNQPQYISLNSSLGSSPVFYQQNIGYVLSASLGLTVYDFSTPTHPSYLGYLQVGGYPTQMVIVGQTGYISDRSTGLTIVNLTNPVAPTLLGSLQLPQGAEGVIVQGNYAYVSGRYAGLRIVNVSDPESPVEVGTCNLPGLTRKSVVQGEYVYVADYESGVKIVNVSNPASPYVVGSWNDIRGGISHDVLVSHDTLFVANAYGGLYMLNVSNPASPQVIGWYYDSYAVGLTRQNNLLYVSDYIAFSVFALPIPELHLLVPNGGEVFDGGTSDTLRWFGGSFPGTLSVSINLNYPNGEWIPILESIHHLGYCPWYIDRVNTTHARIRIMSDEMPELFDESDGDFEIHTDGIASGLSELPDQYKVIVSPNPFNSSTAITLELPTTSDVKLSIFDVTGKTIALLHSGRLSAGNHRIQWHAPVNLASGVYFHRTEIGIDKNTRMTTGKMLLIR